MYLKNAAWREVVPLEDIVEGSRHSKSSSRSRHRAHTVSSEGPKTDTPHCSRWPGAKAPTLRYLDFFGIGTQDNVAIEETMQRCLDKLGSSEPIYVTPNVVEDRLVITAPATHAIIFSRPLEQIDFYESDIGTGFFYICSRTDRGRAECHFFVLEVSSSSLFPRFLFFIAARRLLGLNYVSSVLYFDDHASSLACLFTQGSMPLDAFFIIHKAVTDWHKTAHADSEEVRKQAVSRLTDLENPVPDGAFILRDSSSRPGCFGETGVPHVVEPSVFLLSAPLMFVLLFLHGQPCRSSTALASPIT